MSLIKWFRKNNTKVMAVVVVVLMIAFIGGSALNYLLSPKKSLGHKAVAYFSGNMKIINADLSSARQELEILSILRADELLRSQDLRGVLLAELLFTEGRATTAVINQIRQIIRANRYNISDKQINCLYTRSMPSNIYWLLLKNEAQMAGIRISNEEVGELLAQTIPQLFKGQTYSQLVGSVINRYRIPESEILQTFGRLLSVYQYAQLICLSENVTNSQLMHRVSRENETINVEFVKLDAGYWIHDTRRASNIEHQEPNDEEIQKHFNKYKDIFAGVISEDNPYGFGYKLPDMVQLEYIAVKVDDVSPIVTPPTSAETEQYYQKHPEQFTESFRQDPNDPNSPLIDTTKSYAEVADVISKQLLRDKVNSKAERIIQDAKTLTETGFQDIELAKVDVEQLKQKAGDYEAVAKQLAEKYKIKIYSGRTGLFSAAEMEADKYLRRLYSLGNVRSAVKLTQTVFSIEQLQPDTSAKSSAGGALDVQRMRMYENVGPLRDSLEQLEALVRVIKAQKASAPETIDQSYSKSSIPLDDEIKSEDNKDVYSVKGKLVEDLNKLAVIDHGVLKSKAEEFVKLVDKNSWEIAIDKFNELYPPLPAFARKQGGTATGANDPNILKPERLTDLRRISNETLVALATQTADAPSQRVYVPEVKKWLTAGEAKIESHFVDQLYSLIPSGNDAVKTLLLMDFKPYASLYVIKEITIKRLEQDEYEKIKPKQLFTEEHIRAESLAAVHFNPENILKRMKFRSAGEEKKPADGGAESGDAS